MIRACLCIAMAMSLCAAGLPVRADAIAYRQEIMKTLEAQFQAIMLIVTAGAPSENLHSHLTAALLTARMLPGAFEKRAPGGSSRPQVWTKWDDFARHMREFEAAVAIATEAARGGKKPADVLYHIDAISCRDCHDLYRRY
ncbi:MAG: cytochrome c [Rhodospirillaceae bacterium]